jgi:PleD family two-component response regulator
MPDETPPEERPEWAQVDEGILLVDDSRTSARLLEIQLRSAGYDDVRVAGDGEEALRMVADRCPDVVLADVMMPGMNGLDLARMLRTDPLTTNVSIIMISAKGDDQDRQDGYDAGANDYIVKPFDPPELLARIRGVVRKARERRAWSPITQLPGSVAIEQEIGRRIKEGIDFAVLYADIDTLRSYNRHYGYVLGDQLLRRAGRAAVDAASTIDENDAFVGHYVADEFVIVTTPERAPRIAEETISQFDKVIPTLYDPADGERGYIETEDDEGTSQAFPLVTISIGVAMGEGGTFTHHAQALEAAAHVTKVAKETVGSSWAADVSD